jgi:hypothetical protein
VGFGRLTLGLEGGYSNDELLKFAGHTHQITRTRDYMNSISSVDGQAGFLGAPLRKDLAEDFRSMTVQRNPELFLSLPAKARDELLERDDYVENTLGIESLTRQINAATSPTAVFNFKSQRAELYVRRRRLEQEELERVQENQERIHPSERSEAFYVDEHRTRFNRLRHKMPVRDRLADLLFVKAPLRSPEGVSAIKDLMSLIKDDCKVAYQEPLRPLSGMCPTPGCKKKVDW